MWLFAKCIEATRTPSFIDAQHRAGAVYRRAGYVRRNGGHDAGIPPATFAGIVDHVPGITGHVGPEYLPGQHSRDSIRIAWGILMVLGSREKRPLVIAEDAVS